MKRALLPLLAISLLAAASGAVAQLRTIPQEAKRGTMSHVETMTVNLDGQPQELAPGAQIRDAENRIILPMALPQDSVVRYENDAAGKIRRVWILSPEEAAQADKQ
jgi:hypothetical protein